MKSAITILCIGLFTAWPLHAGVPAFVTYSGRLTDGTGWGESTEATLVFRLYDSATGGTPFWTTTHPDVPVVDGYFTVSLGMCNTAGSCVLDPSEATFPSDLPAQAWLGISVGTDDPELSPREPIGSVPYASRASSADRIEVRAFGQRFSLNAVYRGSTMNHGDLGGSFQADGTTKGAIQYPGEPLGQPSAKKACEHVVGSPTAHMCTAEEMDRSMQMGLHSLAFPQRVATGQVALLQEPDGMTTMSDCGGWHNDLHTQEGGAYHDVYPTAERCDDYYPIACCDFPAE